MKSARGHAASFEHLLFVAIRIARFATFPAAFSAAGIACGNFEEEGEAYERATTFMRLAEPEPEAPRCLEGFGRCLDLSDTPDAPRGPGGTAVTFDCYGACGASCDMQNKTVTTATRCQTWRGSAEKHRTLTYRVLSGATHSFCRWHDSCYLECAKHYDEAGDARYGCCTAYCDYACQSPQAFNTSCGAGRYAPWFWERTVTGGIAMQRVCGNVDDYVAPTCRSGHVPNANAANWTTLDCVAWATTAAGVDPGSVADSDGTVSFTELASVGAWQPGACP
jgi:hypothetical protein